MSITLKIDGFYELIRAIEKAEGSSERATKTCMEKSAKIMHDTLKQEMQNSNVDNRLVNAMPQPIIESDYGLITARVGYKKGPYNPDELSDGYKAVFLNYGTPNRTKHGKIKQGGKVKLGYIARAKSKAEKRIQAEQEKTLKDILKGLER